MAGHLNTSIKNFLDGQVVRYNNRQFIADDPVSIPHRFSRKEDIEISAWFAATLAWGQRKTILKNAGLLMQKMDYAPFDFILHHSKKELHLFKNFVHRTFNSDDCIFFITSLKNIYQKHKGLENAFISGINKDDINLARSINHFRKLFFSINHRARVKKHVADPLQNSSCKRINMFLRWMVRKDNCGVDFGLWNISPALLSCPLDVHSARIAREFGLLTRKQNDWKAVCELTENLKKFDADDPVKYDFALFGMGVMKRHAEMQV